MSVSFSEEDSVSSTIFFFFFTMEARIWGGGRVCANEFPIKFWFPGRGATFERWKNFEVSAANNEDIGPLTSLNDDSTL